MQIDINEEQPTNALSSIRDNFDPYWNVNASRDWQFEKHPWQMTFTEAGMQIDFSDEQSMKVDASIRDNFDSDSNVSDSTPSK
jgi:hypothetical protein